MINRLGLRGLWSEGQTAVGAWMTMREPLLAEQASKSGYDYVCVDMQHGFCDFTQAVTMIQAISVGVAIPIVRVPWNEQGFIGRLLDAGALGVIIPMVNTAADARLAVQACRYPPLGSRSFGPHVPRVRYGADYPSLGNDMVACLPMIETIEAVQNIDEIVAVPGVDGIYVGPADLSASLGLPPAMNNISSVLDDALAAILAACQRHGTIAGIHATPAMAAQQFLAGYRMITVAGDMAPALQALQANVTSTRESIANA